MSLLGSFLGLRSAENPATPLSRPASWLVDLFGGETSAGVNVTPRTSLQVSAVYACVRVIAEGVASLPLVLYERLAPRGKRRATEEPTYDLLRLAPNAEMTSFSFFELLTAHVNLWGNGYARIVRTRGGRVSSLLPLEPWTVAPRRRDGTLEYVVQTSAGPEVFDDQEVLHVRGLGIDGLVGLSPVGLARRGIGVSVAAEEFGARFFGSGARPGGLLEHPGVLGDEARKNLRESWEALHAGPEGAHRLAILEEGMTYHALGIPPDDAQFLETRKFQVAEIARLFRVPPHLIGDLEKATFSNIEQQSIDFVTHTLRPWLVRWEQEIHRKLVPVARRATLFPEFLVDALLRGDTAARYAAYSKGRQWGWLSADDVREFENQNPLPEGRGEIYLTPLNMGEAPASDEAESAPDVEEADDLADAPPPAGPEALRAGMAAAHLPVHVDAVARTLRRAARRAERALPRLQAAAAEARAAVAAEVLADVAAEAARDLRPAALAFVSAAAVVRPARPGPEAPEVVATRAAADYARDFVAALHEALVTAGPDAEEEIARWNESRAREYATAALARLAEEVLPR